MSNKNNIENIKKTLDGLGFSLVSKEYKNAHQKLKIECPEHGVFEMRFNSIQQGQRCPKCSHKSTKYTIKEVSDIIKKKKCKLISKNYYNNSQKLEIECSKHGIFKRSLDSYKQSKYGCAKCGIEMRSVKNRNDYKYIKDYIEKKGYTLITSQNNYKNNKTKLELQCFKHGIFKIKFNDITQGHGCSACSIESNSDKSRNELIIIKEWIKENTPYTLISDNYKNNKTKLEIECSKHGIFKMNWLHIKNKHGCPKCQTVVSKQHQKIVDYIKETYKGEVEINNRSLLEGKELDIYIKEYNFAIEFDGLYWHSEKLKKSAKKDNIDKIKLINKNNINILMIYEDEWNNNKKQNLIKAMINSRIGIKPQNIVRASKLELKKLEKNNQFKNFFENYHLDGHTTASFAYGLFLNNELISCMSFRKSIHDKCWEIARFATNYNYTVHGNAGRMVKMFKKEYNEKLITYSNNRLSHGNVYKQLGFTEITTTISPSYYYTDFKTRLWRFKCKRINDPEILSKYPTEQDQAEGGVFSQKYLGHNKPLYKIYDYGHKKWVL